MIGLEVCVDTIEGLDQAAAAGATRIELCGPLAVGGTTPSVGLIEAARGCIVPVYAMIRPRAGGFVFSPADEAAMLAEIRFVRAAGLAGVVLGASRGMGRLMRLCWRGFRRRQAGSGARCTGCSTSPPIRWRHWRRQSGSGSSGC